MNDAWLVFLHGINAAEQNLWLEPLNNAITRAGHEPFPEGRIIAPDYRKALRGDVEVTTPPRNSWKNPGKDKLRDAETKHIAKRALLESRLRHLSGDTPASVKGPKIDGVPPIDVFLGDAIRYSKTPKVRDAAQTIALKAFDDIPADARVIIVAHSLGSVVAADIIKKLPPRIHVSALITIGSPLGAVGAFRNKELDEYPFDRLGAWINIFDPRDPVTGGRGVSEEYAQAIDLPITLQDWMIPILTHRHGADFYCSNGAMGQAIATALLSTDLVSPDAVGSTNVRGLELPLLQSLYLRELAKRLPADAERIARLERARSITATEHSQAAVLLHRRSGEVAALPPSEFLQRPDAHIRDAWDDGTVLALAIMLASSPPAPPFEIEVKVGTEERRKALVATLSLIRSGTSAHTDIDIEEAVFAELKAVTEYLSPGRSWIPVAIVGVGVVTLAATGIGMAVAAPAGLAGAALITSTLAAFGPGGMVGGMATLAALASVGSAMAAGGGAVIGAHDPARGKVDLVSVALDEALSSGDPSQMRALLISLLALTSVQERLNFPSQRGRVLRSCLSVKGALAQRAAEHESIDPKSDRAKAVRETLKILEKACRWLRGEDKPRTPEAEQWRALTTSYPAAIESGKTDGVSPVASLPAGPSDQPALAVGGDLPQTASDL